MDQNHVPFHVASVLADFFAQITTIHSLRNSICVWTLQFDEEFHNIHLRHICKDEEENYSTSVVMRIILF